MNAIKREKNRNYTTISNVFLRDKCLSVKAKGFLAVVMSLPEDWDFTINGICAVLKEGKTAIYNIITELKMNGYCSMDLCQNEKGIITGNDYSFSETPKKEWIEKVLKACCENPHTENRDADNQDADNPTQRSKESKEIKNEQNKEGNISNEISPQKVRGNENEFSESRLPCGAEDRGARASDNPERKVAPKEKPTKEPWRESFDEYMKLVREGAAALKADANFRADIERIEPNVDYDKTIDSCVSKYWGTETGWEKKRRSRTKKIDMKATLRQNFDKNRIYKERQASYSGGSRPRDVDTHNVNDQWGDIVAEQMRRIEEEKRRNA